MSTVYLQHRYHSIGVGPTGHNHTRAEPDDGETPTAIDCDVCAPYLVRDFGGVYNPDLVPLTDRQVAAREKADREGNSAVRQAAEAMARQATAVSRAEAAEAARAVEANKVAEVSEAAEAVEVRSTSRRKASDDAGASNTND